MRLFIGAGVFGVVYLVSVLRELMASVLSCLVTNVVSKCSNHFLDVRSRKNLGLVSQIEIEHLILVLESGVLCISSKKLLLQCVSNWVSL